MNASHPAAFSSRTLLVLGCGYVGTAVVEAALQKGVRVVALTRNPATAASLRALGAGTIEADLALDTWHARAPRAPDWVLNCVAGGGGGLEGYRHAYLQGMQSVQAWLRGPGSGTGAFAYTSSTSVYPQGEGVVVAESAPTAAPGDDSPAGILAATEQVVRGFAPDSCGRAVVLRLAGIYGPTRIHLVEQVKQGVVSGNGDVHLNLIHRDDIVSAIWTVFGANVDSGREQIFNVADDGAARKGDVVAWLADRLGVAAPTFTGLPAGGRQRATPDRIISNQRLKETFGWRPRYSSFREGYAAILPAVSL